MARVYVLAFLSALLSFSVFPELVWLPLSLSPLLSNLFYLPVFLIFPVFRLFLPPCCALSCVPLQSCEKVGTETNVWCFETPPNFILNIHLHFCHLSMKYLLLYFFVCTYFIYKVYSMHFFSCVHVFLLYLSYVHLFMKYLLLHTFKRHQ